LHFSNTRPAISVATSAAFVAALRPGWGRIKPGIKGHQSPLRSQRASYPNNRSRGAARNATVLAIGRN
jgi:hypothetical protein